VAQDEQMTASELSVRISGRELCVREAGDRNGRPVLFFHGCPSSRLDLHRGADLATACGIRLVSFDRPGYGRSTEAPFTLMTIARDAVTILDRLGIERVGLLGQSAGSQYALAAAAALGDRASFVGIASGAGPVDLVPGALDGLAEEDAAAYALRDDPEAAARLFAALYGPVVELARRADDDELVAAFEPVLADVDVALLREPSTRAGAAANLREALRQGCQGAACDNVNWVRPWGFGIDEVRCPVVIWVGEDDTIPMDNAYWLRDRLDATLVLWPGEGHLAYKRHLRDIFEWFARTAA